MVDEAVKAACAFTDEDGKPYKVYHGTKNDFTVFDPKLTSEQAKYSLRMIKPPAFITFTVSLKKTQGADIFSDWSIASKGKLYALLDERMLAME